MIVGHTYDKQTGEISATRYSGSTRELAMEFMPTDAGWVDGEHDHLRQRVDVQTGAVVDYESPALAEHERQQQIAVVRSELQRLELAALPRAQREALLYGDRESLVRAVQIDLRCAQLVSFLNPGPAADARIARAQSRLAELNQP